MPLPAGHFDAPTSGSFLRNPATIRGWAMFPSGPPARIELWLGEEFLGRARLGLERPDIQIASADPRGAVSGFSLAVDLTQYPNAAGQTALRGLAIGSAGERLELEPVPVQVSTDPVPPLTTRSSPAPPPPKAGGSTSRRHRVLVCTHQLDLGGAQTFLVQLVRGLIKLDAIEPTVLSALGGPLRQEFEDLGVPVHVSTPLPLDDLDSHIDRVEELTAWAAEGDFDIALINTASALTIPGAEVADLLGIPAIWAIHESFPPAILWADLDPSVYAVGTAALANAAMAVFEAEATQRLYEETIPPDRCLTLPYGLDFDPIDEGRAGFDREGARRAASVPADAEVLLCVGSIEPRKAQVSLAQAFDLIADRHPSARLIFLGGRKDAHTDLLEGWIHSLESRDRIRIVSMTPDVHRWYGLADILVCASDIESLPRTVLEGMAWELPVLATNVFGLSELIEDGKTGWLCADRDVEALATALDRALSSTPEERVEMGHTARALVERRHSLDAYCEEISQLLDRATDRMGPKPVRSTTDS